MNYSEKETVESQKDVSDSTKRSGDFIESESSFEMPIFDKSDSSVKRMNEKVNRVNWGLQDSFCTK